MNIRRFFFRTLLPSIALSCSLARSIAAQHFSSGSSSATKFGVHEIVLKGDSPTGNPFDIEATVRFLPPSGESNAKTVQAFYDGDTTWRARVYVAEPGEWRWTSRCAANLVLDGKTGTFQASASALRGRLLPHVKNPRHWMTEDGRWFLNLNDTAYFMLGIYAGTGEPATDADFKNYVRDAVQRGITSFRSRAFTGPHGHLEDSRTSLSRWRDAVFDDDAFTRLQLPHFKIADERLRWLLDEYPDVYMQFILFPRGASWSLDDRMWVKFTALQKTRIMRYIIARYAAYPQVFWLVTNDAHYGDKYPNNNAFAREVGEYFRRHDPWQHPMSAGHARKIDYAFGGEAWSTYIHLEDSFDLGASQYAKYHALVKDVEGVAEVRAPKLMRRGQQEFLIYHPNAVADDRHARPDDARTPSVIVDLSRARGTFAVEWHRAHDGTAQAGGTIAGGKPQMLRSPWRGEDVVLRLVAQAWSTGRQASPPGVKAYRDLH